MLLKEYQGKQLFNEYGILIPRGEIITAVKADPLKIAKAQLPEGKRGKRGLILPATKKNLKELFRHCSEILIEENLEIEKEYYLALTIDRNEKEVVILFSEEGGADIEETKKLIKVPYSNLSEFPKKEFIPVINAMYNVMKDYNALLVEINPLARVKGKLIAVDSKIILDDNAKNIKFEEKETKLESEAKKYGLTYVELEGDIAVIGNGAGLVMATLDIISHFGGKVANFLDIGGGASSEKMEKSLEIIFKKKPKSLFINIFGGITRCDKIAQGTASYKNKNNITIPIVVRMIGTNEKKAIEILGNAGIKTCDSLEEGAKKAVQDANK